MINNDKAIISPYTNDSKVIEKLENSTISVVPLCENSGFNIMIISEIGMKNFIVSFILFLAPCKIIKNAIANKKIDK